MLSAILSWIDPISRISKVIADAYISRNVAATDKEKINAEERIKALEARRDVMIAESGSTINAIMRIVFAVPPAIYLAKLYVWDKVLAWGTTDPLSPMLEGIMWSVVGFYFLDQLARRLKR